LIGLNTEQSAETANGLCVQPLCSVGPAKGMGIKFVPSRDGHFKVPHLWPGQNTPATGQDNVLILGAKIHTFSFFIQGFSFAFR